MRYFLEGTREMARIQKGFISLGTAGTWLNIDYVDQKKSYFDTRFNKVAVIDIYGGRFNVDPKLCRGKIKWRESR